jgi:hypothetical protein
MKYCLLLLLIPAILSHGAEVIRLDGMSIQGNSEEPSVLYITPWQPAPGTGLLFTPVNSYREQWLKPVSRQMMKREAHYLNNVQKKRAESDTDQRNK